MPEYDVWPALAQNRVSDALFQISAGRREYHARSVGRDRGIVACIVPAVGDVGRGVRHRVVDEDVGSAYPGRCLANFGITGRCDAKGIERIPRR
jgi:hypothetical protein